MSEEKYILVEYDGSGHGADVYTLSLMTEKKWSEIKDYAKKHPNRGPSNETYGGRSSDLYDTLKNIIDECIVYEDEIKIDAFKTLFKNRKCIGNGNIFDCFNREYGYSDSDSDYESDLNSGPNFDNNLNSDSDLESDLNSGPNLNSDPDLNSDSDYDSD